MKKKSAKKAAERFTEARDAIDQFVSDVDHSGLSEANRTWVYEYAVIRLYREFEALMLNCLIAAVNNDTTQLSTTTGIVFPKHLTDEVCEFVITGGGYFDFRGRDGLIKTLRKYLPESHYLLTVVKSAKYKAVLDRLLALRNFAAHNSAPSKSAALRAIDARRLSSPGAWLKTQGRWNVLSSALGELADDILNHAPY